MINKFPHHLTPDTNHYPLGGGIWREPLPDQSYFFPRGFLSPYSFPDFTVTQKDQQEELC